MHGWGFRGPTGRGDLRDEMITTTTTTSLAMPELLEGHDHLEYKRAQVPFLCLQHAPHKATHPPRPNLHDPLIYKVRAFTGEGCTGDAKEINVWDNSRRNHDLLSDPIRSFRVLAYGAHRQRALLFPDKKCLPWPTEETRNFWADGGSDKFLKDECLTIEYDVQGFGSYSA
ncbi:uncharacterized protein BJX67DRAFT_379851 [Aspergillus lucknowensis]|uniref:Uncharacterized protein n=1 Tax=Aspergillus lucknowensis TaxID=176173 RepID=A0ABR4LWR3_9EURO